MINATTQDLLKQVEALVLQEPDESRPHDHRYNAADLLKGRVDELVSHAAHVASTGPELSTATQTEDLAVLRARRGILLLDTDLLADGEASIMEALPVLQSMCSVPGSSQQPSCSPSSDAQAPNIAQSNETPHHLALLQECYNALGALYSTRGDYEKATEWLSAAEKLYNTHAAALVASHQAQRVACGDSNDEEAAPRASSSCQPALSPAVEGAFTSTLFFLAQVHGHAQRRDRSALYCAATLQRQLKSGDYQLNEWVQNCLQLAGYYTTVNAFAIAEYCLRAAACVVEQHQQRQQQQPSPGAAPAGDDGAATAEADASHSQPPASAAPQSQVLEADVAANTQLAWAKLAMARLATSHEVHVEHRQPELSYPAVENLPDVLRFPMLQLPSPSSFRWGRDALVRDFDGARDVFNAGMTAFRSALEYYKLDGWVTEHVNTVMDVSNMYRLLAGFESDSGRRAAMHKQRAARLEPLSGALNATFYPGLSRSVDLELGNIWREVLEIKADEAGPGGAAGTSKAVAAAAVSATRYYTRFIDSFRAGGDPRGVLPDRVDPDNEGYFLTASFSLGRVMHRCNPGGKDSDTSLLARAFEHLQWTAHYVQRHGLTAFSGEAALALELSALVAEKIKLLHRQRAQQQL